MSRKLTPRSSLETLRTEAKRWLKALRAQDPVARARLVRALPDTPANPTLRDVQHALAHEYGFPGWTALRRELDARRAASSPSSRVDAIQALFTAAEQGDAARVATVLAAWPDIVNERAVLAGHTGRRTALHFAMNRSSEAVTEVLLAHGADPNIRDDGDNAMPLHFAAEHGSLGIVRRLIERGADPIGAADHHELDVIGWATVFARTLNRELVDYLLSHGARHNISSAVVMGDAGAIRAVVAADAASLNRAMDATNHHRRPLHLAVLRNETAALDALLALGADTEAEDAAGLTPLDQAALADRRDLADRLIAHGARVRLPAAVALERHEDVARLLRDEPDALRPGGRWDKLLIRASEHGTARVVEALIRAGASVHARDNHRTSVDGTHGYTALHAAAFNNNTAAVRVLLEYGANPADREDKYWETPAGWAAYAGHTALRDIIMDAPGVDIFDAILFDRADRLRDVLQRDPLALERRFDEYVNGDKSPRPRRDPAWTPAAFAVAEGKRDALRVLIEHGADLTVRDSSSRTLLDLAELRAHPDIADLIARQTANAARRTMPLEDPDERVARFLRMACLDWRVNGSERVTRMQDAGRLLEQHPELARANFYTAVACGDVSAVQDFIDARPGVVHEIGGPRAWPPLLYLCATRLPQQQASDNAVTIARLLLDHGADPNAFSLGGNADIHYTAFTWVMGRGEDLESVHPRARELVALLLERGADPHDGQVLYNVFADNTSRHLLDNDIIWLLELMYAHSVRRGHKADWDNPAWPMFDMAGAPSLGHEDRRLQGARFMLDAAVDSNLVPLATWMLEHGAGPNAPAGTVWKGTTRTLYQKAVARGHDEMAALLIRYGATPQPPVLDGHEALLNACMRMDRATVASMIAAHSEYLTDNRLMRALLREDRADAVEMLLDLGASPDLAEPGTGARALHAAAASNALRCAALLIARGASVDARDAIYHSPPLGWASHFQHARMIELLGRHSRDVWQLTCTGQVERLRTVLAEEPERARAVNEGDGRTPLMWLPGDSGQALEIATLLVQAGADPAHRALDGRTAAEIAEARGLDAVARHLRAGGTTGVSID